MDVDRQWRPFLQRDISQTLRPRKRPLFCSLPRSNADRFHICVGRLSKDLHMTSVDVNAVVSAARFALSALNSPTATPHAIREAQGTLVSIKSALTPSTVLPVVQSLLSSILAPAQQTAFAPNEPQTPATLPEIHFGFHLLDEILMRSETPWAALSDQVRSEARRICITAAQTVACDPQPPLNSSQYPLFVREKSAALLTAIAIREWPQRWPSFLDDLLADPLRVQLACHVLRILSEDIHDFPDLIAPTRRNELNHAMALTLSQTLRFITTAADKFLESRNLDALTTALTAIEAFLSWAALPEVFACGVPNACIALLADEHTRMLALSALRVLVCRRVDGAASSRPERDSSAAASATPVVQIATAFRDLVFPGLMSFVSNSSVLKVAAMSYAPPIGALPGATNAYNAGPPNTDSIDDEEHHFHVNVITLLAELGSMHFASLYLINGTKGNLIPSMTALEQAAAYVDVMLCATAGPSVEMKNAAQPFFNSVLSTIRKSSDELTNLALVELLVVGYLHAASLSLVRWPNDALYKAYSDVDYDGEPGARRYRNHGYKGRTISNIGLAAKVIPEVALSIGLKRVTDLLGQIRSAPQDGAGNSLLLVQSREKLEITTVGNVRAQNLIVPNGSRNGWSFGLFPPAFASSLIAAVEASVSAAEAMLAGVTSSKLLERDLTKLESLQQAFDAVICITDAKLLPVRASALKLFVPLYAARPQALQSSLESMIAQASNSGASKDSRYRACTALSSLCRRLCNVRADSMSQFRKPLCEYTAQALTGDQFGAVEKILLLEASIVCVMVMGSAIDQTPWMEGLLQPMLRTLATPGVDDVLASPITLYTFIDTASTSDRSRLCSAFQILEAAMHQVVRPQSHAQTPLVLPGALSQSVAPNVVIVSAKLVASLHGMYNNNKFPLGDQDGARRSVLLPTSSEITYLLNLEGSSNPTVWSSASEYGSNDDAEGQGSDLASRSDDSLARFGITPPDPLYRVSRETLKNLRNAGYELLRVAILSGVTQSPVHLQALLNAICVDYQFLEPIHLYYLTTKVLRVLLSYTVVATDASFLSTVSSSTVPALLNLICEHVESCSVGDVLSSDVATLDVARDHGRKMLARAAANMLQSMYPKVDPSKKKGMSDAAVSDEALFLPPALGHDGLGKALMSLWRTLCSPKHGTSNDGASRIALLLVAVACEAAPDTATSIYMPLLQICLQTAIQHDGMASDSPLDPAVSAIVTMIRKWPEGCELELMRFMANETDDVQDWVRICVSRVKGDVGSSRARRQARNAVRTLVGNISQAKGVSSRKQQRVQALPERLVTHNPSRRRAKSVHELEEIVLGDQALDSLFGGGEPM